ncbi:hypothetical protein FF38_12459 [Lucilia cuprina]|uniref:Testin n=1 Tax=Lucilia cuprina TaxID=7375 RepID=A0A0L0CIV6_LUCCU|nr:Testin [Lucilia cuprina]KNC32338.1 hypothetical protein FF38_12459 [Lucilia cuprina]
MSNNNNSCVETPAAPDWLSKLEDRREKLKRAKLGHEAGAGAPCNECGLKCPGLDLHFWRKVCRNCKCRKDQHMCPDDEVTGWAQFEILGQIRSKPAFIKIKTLANQPVKVEWVPPNIAPDLAADYMEKLGSANVPVAGSEAAAKRKQQLEFQVPPHDLDAGFCDNLTESEADQLQQYVQKIRDNCVGQGSVVRVGNYANAMLGTINTSNKVEGKYAEVMHALQETPIVDETLSTILSNEKLAKAITENLPCDYPKIFVVFSEAICDAPFSAKIESKLTPAIKQKLRGLNEAAVQSLILNGPIYDKIFGVLKKKNFDISRDPRLGPLSDLRKEYLCNPFAKKELENAFGTQMPFNQSSFNSPLKTPSKFSNDLSFNSPLPLKTAANLRSGSQMLQDTPIRKVQFGNSSTIVYDCNLPPNVDYERDPIFAKIIRSEPLIKAVQISKSTKNPQSILMSTSVPMSSRGIAEMNLSDPVKEKLKQLGIESTDMLQSAVLNAPFYERLFSDLQEKNINYDQCKLLKPFELLGQELRINRPLYEEVREYVTSLPNSLDVAYAPLNMGLQQALSVSKSSDSGFDSKPSTPIQSTIPQGYADEVNALSGKLMSIPGIQEMNMYPTVEVSKGMKGLSLTEQHPQKQNKQFNVESTPMLKCRDCSKTINFGEVAVKAERAGKEIAWHPECFKCYTCRELLADLVYFFHGGQVFCGRDLALKLKIPRCKACDELIFTKEYTAAEGATFHIKHFCCYHCDLPLAGQQYIPDEKSNMPLCLKCYDEYFAIACQRCSQPIGPSDQGVAWGDIHWHDSCFICAGKGCGKSLIGGRFCVKQNMPFCSPACVHSIIK